MHRRFTNTPQWVVTLLVVITLTSCYRIESTTEVNNDGSGQLSYLLALNYEAVAALGETDSTTREEFCQDIQSDTTDVPPGASIEPYDEDGYCGLTTTVDIAPNTNFVQALTDATGSTQDQLTDFTLTKEADDQWTFTQSLEDPGISSADESSDDPDAALLEETLDITYTIILPGQPAANNADSATLENDKTTFFWDVNPFGNTTNLEASTTAGSTADIDTNSGEDQSIDSAQPTTAPDTNPSRTTTQSDQISNTDDAETDDSSDYSSSGNDEDATIAEVDLGFVDDGSGPATPSTTNDSSQTKLLVGGLFGILAVLGAVCVLILKWPSSTTSGSSGPPGPPTTEPPADGPFAA